MIFEGVELHNVDEVVPHKGGVRLHRVPALGPERATPQEDGLTERPEQLPL